MKSLGFPVFPTGGGGERGQELQTPTGLLYQNRKAGKKQPRAQGSVQTSLKMLHEATVLKS